MKLSLVNTSERHWRYLKLVHNLSLIDSLVTSLYMRPFSGDCLPMDFSLIRRMPSGVSFDILGFPRIERPLQGYEQNLAFAHHLLFLLGSFLKIPPQDLQVFSDGKESPMSLSSITQKPRRHNQSRCWRHLCQILTYKFLQPLSIL